MAQVLTPLASRELIILGLPRGGVPVAYEVAKALSKPLDVIIVRKLGVPWQPELAFGALGEGDVVYLNQSVIDDLAISKAEQDEVIRQEQEEIRARQTRFRGDQAPFDLKGKSAVIVDDGIATGATAQAACKVVSNMGAKEIIIAAPVATKESIRMLKEVATKCIVIDTPENFHAVGQWYEDFPTVTDTEVLSFLNKYRGEYGD